MEIDKYYLKDVGVAWCVSEYCKQVDLAGVRIEGSDGVTNFISQLSDICTLGKVELSVLGFVDGELSQVSYLYTHFQLRVID